MIVTADSTHAPIKSRSARLVYVDPPFNTGKNLGEHLNDSDYQSFIFKWLKEAKRIADNNSWLVICVGRGKTRYLHEDILYRLFTDLELVQELVWIFNFGTYTQSKFVPCHETLLVFRIGEPTFYADKIRIPSQRMLVGDIRADYRGRVPSSYILDIPRVPGNSKERQFIQGKGQTCQPQKLCNLLVKAYTVPGELVVDLFSGSGSMSKSCMAYSRKCIALEINHEWNKESNQRLENWKL